MNWTIVTVIVCTMLLAAEVRSYFLSLMSALAVELEEIKRRLDQLKSGSEL